MATREHNGFHVNTKIEVDGCGIEMLSVVLTTGANTGSRHYKISFATGPLKSSGKESLEWLSETIAYQLIYAIERAKIDAVDNVNRHVHGLAEALGYRLGGSAYEDMD